MVRKLVYRSDRLKEPTTGTTAWAILTGNNIGGLHFSASPTPPAEPAPPPPESPFSEEPVREGEAAAGGRQRRRGGKCNAIAPAEDGGGVSRKEGKRKPKTERQGEGKGRCVCRLWTA